MMYRDRVGFSGCRVEYERSICCCLSCPPEVGWIMRKAAARATSYLHVAKADDGSIIWKWKLAVKSGESKFKFSEEFEESTPDGRKVKVSVKVKPDINTSL